MSELSIHAKAVNIARRISAQTENDMMHSCAEEAEPRSPRKYDHAACADISSRIVTMGGLPVQCKKYNDVVANMRRRESDRTDGTEMLG